MTGITGSTRLYAVLGDPVTQVQAPAMLNPVFAGLGLDAVLVPVHVEAADLAGVVTGLQRIGNLDGLLVTVPHKIEACAFADVLSPAVRAAGSTNAMRREPDGRWTAENFDGTGFVRGMAAAGHELAGRRVTLVGAGGAGGAIAAAVLDAGAARLQVCDPDEEKLSDLLDRLAARGRGRVAVGPAPELERADVAVNATPLGLRADDPLPFDPASLPAGAVVADIIMQPRETPLLRAATAAGRPVHHGAHMLSHQLDLYREFFRLGEFE
ncbi:shikimate dehydrogenase family protein [Streptomyces sp. NBC_01643]|uniref:shikimate dehydrogenase family protein n=1 Tax=Streptomyces sp. NBC_01643 TaxID=2975906 RepID=UPI0038653A9C|nr:shikimate dehydrogenase [Streptomyces sp. NBC_01643]